MVMLSTVMNPIYHFENCKIDEQARVWLDFPYLNICIYKKSFDKTYSPDKNLLWKIKQAIGINKRLIP